ncbi:hypothetical protein JW964_28820 [candidate division KSB1 bacterium]|nr:hypothetical protein [candidate division KSB1 bacterium]
MSLLIRLQFGIVRHFRPLPSKMIIPLVLIKTIMMAAGNILKIYGDGSL